MDLWKAEEPSKQPGISIYERLKGAMASPDTLFISTSEINRQTQTKELGTPPIQKPLNWYTYQSKRADCGQFRATFNCKHCKEPIDIPMGCGYRTCPTCARRYGDRLYRELLEVSKGLPQTATHRFRQITLSYGTKKGMKEGMNESQEALKKIWRSYLRPRLNPGHLPAKYGKAALFAAVEFGPKHNSVHIHVLYWGPWVDRQKLLALWKKHTGSFIVDVRACRKVHGIREAVKYVSKGTARNDYRSYGIEKALYSSRRVITYGEFRNRKAKLGENFGKTVCKYCGFCEWTLVSIARKEENINRELCYVRKNLYATPYKKTAAIWENPTPSLVTQPMR